MKTILFVTGVLLICIVPMSLLAENEAIDRGSFEFGLGTVFNLTLYSGNIEANELTLGTSAPTIGSGIPVFNVGYFIANRFAVGGTFSFYKLKFEGATESYNEFLFGPYLTYYIPVTERFLANLSGNFYIISWEYPGDIDRSSQIWFGGNGGATYLITNNLGIKGGFGFLYSPNYKDQGIEVADTSYTTIAISLGFTVYI